MPRIAMLSVHTCPLASLGQGKAGGMNVYVRYLASELARRGLDVDVFTLAHAAPQEERITPLAPRVRVVHLAEAPIETPLAAVIPLLPAFTEELVRFQEVQGAGYGLVHSHYWLSGVVGSEVAARWGIPHVVTFHTLAELKLQARSEEKEAPERRALEAELAASAGAVVVFSQHEGGALARLYGVLPSRIAVIPAGVDTQRFRPLGQPYALRELGLGRKRVLLAVGRLEPLKGLDLLLQAAALLEDDGVQVVIVGGEPANGTERARLETLADGLGIRGQVRFEGPVPQERLPLYYSAAHALVMPSYYESFGLVALEAMSCGTPVVGARVGGLASLVKDGQTGYLVSARCPGAYALHLEPLLKHRVLRRALGRAARQYALGMDWKAIAQQIVSLYRDVGLEGKCALG